MAASAATQLNMDNEIFRSFIFYAGLVLLKTVLMSLLTVRYRVANTVFPSREDYGSKAPVTLPVDEHIERIRRAHRNDLENVIPFVLLGLLYILTGPDVTYALLHFRLFAGARLMHTFVYLWAVPQPSRFIAFLGGTFVNISMAFMVLTSGAF